MHLQVPPELEAKLARLAENTGRGVDEVALDLLTIALEHDEWFRHGVEQGRASAREGRLLSTTKSRLVSVGAIPRDACPLDDRRG